MKSNLFRVEESVVSKMETTTADGKRCNTNYYNLDVFLQFNEEDILQNKGAIVPISCRFH